MVTYGRNRLLFFSTSRYSKDTVYCDYPMRNSIKQCQLCGVTILCEFRIRTELSDGKLHQPSLTCDRPSAQCSVLSAQALSE